MSKPTHRLKLIKDSSKWLVLPNDLNQQLAFHEELSRNNDPQLAKAIEGKLEEWRRLVPEKGSRSPELNPLKAELWNLLSAYESKTGHSFCP
jgi:hypothetical protein